MNMKKIILTLLALLMTAVTGAWAQEQSETIATTAKIVEGTHFTISNNDSYFDGDGMCADGGITVTSKNGETITKVVISCTYGPDLVNDGTTSVSSGTKEITNGGETITVTGVNASTFTFTCSNSGPMFGQFVVYYTEAPAGPAESIDLTTTDNLTWTLASMPGYDVELEVEYFPLATLATTPAAAEGVVEGTDAALLTPGTSAEGTLAYALGTSEAPTGQWSDAIPTAQDLEAGTCYVWYKVVGDAEHSDSQPQSIAVTIAEAPAYAVTIDDAGVDASNWQATPAEPKTGQTVTLSYGGKKKIRSITIEKAATAPAAAIAPALMDGATVVIECNCDGFVTYFTFTNNGGTYSCNITGDESDYFSASLTKQGNTLVFVAQHSDMPDSFDSTINFDTTSDTYSFAKKAEDFFYFKISVNGTDITDKLSETALAGPVTYTELNGGEVLHVGDIINLSEMISFNGGYYMGSNGSPFTVLRADVTYSEDDWDWVVNEKADGKYYVIKSDDGDYYHFEGALGVTSTSDGILVTYNGISEGFKDYTFTVHEP